MAGPFLVGVDVGTTSVKTALFDCEGYAHAQWSGPIAIARPSPGRVEQNPNDWVEATLKGLHAVAGDVPAGAILGLGLCSQVNTHVFVGEDGAALAPAIVWQDGRCAAEAARLDAEVPAQKRLAWWAAPLPIDASHVLSRIAWMAQNHPEIWSRTRWVMAPKDYCLLKLTGEACADPLSSFGVVDSSLAYIDELIALAPGAAKRLPPLLGIAAKVGRVRTGLQCGGATVANATMDAWAGMLGAGAAHDGDAAYLSGTSEVGGIVSRTRVPTSGVIVFPECEGIVLHTGPTQAGGASVAWAGALLGRTAEDISALAAQSDPARPMPIFLPHLQGERAPLWDIAARASFAGLDASMGAPELARAVLEGVACSVRLLMGTLEASAGLRPERLRHAGGGARSDVWCQIRADILGRGIDRAANLDAGLTGAAVLAGLATGAYPTIDEGVAKLSRTERAFEPNPAAKSRADDVYARYLDLYRRLKGFGSPAAS